MNVQGQTVLSRTKTRQGLMQDPKRKPWIMRECEKHVISNGKAVVGVSTKSLGQSHRQLSTQWLHTTKTALPKPHCFSAHPLLCVCHLQPEAMCPEFAHDSQIRVNISFQSDLQTLVLPPPPPPSIIFSSTTENCDVLPQVPGNPVTN